MISMLRSQVHWAIVCGILLTTILPVGVFAGGDANSAPPTSMDATLQDIPNDKTEAGKMIFEKIIEALGGRQKLLNIQDSKISVDYKVMPGNLDLMAVYYMKLPDKLRIDLDNIWTKAFDGISGWEFDVPYSSFKKLSKAALEEFKISALSVQGMLNPENLNIAPVFEGRAPLQGRNCLVISYANRNGYDKIYVYVDPDTFLPFVSTSIKSGGSIDVVCSEYREIDGVKLPFSIGINMDGNKAILMSVREWKLNSNLEDALFIKDLAKKQLKKGQQLDLTGFVDSVPNPELIHRVRPVYPELAARARITSKVILRIAVDEEGRVRDIRVFRGHPLLNDAAITAVKQWKYRPTIQDGKPVSVTIMVPVEFK